MFAFLVFCTADGKRERGARMELTLRIGVDREGDEEREDGRERGDVAVAGAVPAVVLILSALTARAGVPALGDSTGEVAGGDSEIGEITNVLSRRRSRASSMMRLTCSIAASNFFGELKCIWRSRRPCTSITRVWSRENLQRSSPLTPLTRATGIR